MTTSASSKAGAEATAVILGASGAVGKPLLSLLVSESSPYAKVYSFARRAHPSPPPVAANVQFKEVLVDFEKLYNGDQAEATKLSSVSPDAVFITMGTTRAQAGSMAAFEKIDRGYVTAAARALLHPTKPATLVYCSSGMGPSSSSWFPYLKSKGLTEEALAALYPKCIIMRPGFLLNAERSQSRLMENLASPAFTLAAKLSDSPAAPVTDVAKAILSAAQLGPTELKAKRLAQQPDKNFKLEQGKAIEGIAVVANPAIMRLARDQI